MDHEEDIHQNPDAPEPVLFPIPQPTLEQLMAFYKRNGTLREFLAAINYEPER